MARVISTMLPEGAQFYTPDEVAMYLRISRMSMYRLLGRGEIPAVRAGRQYRIPAKAFEEWEAAQCDGS